MMIIILIVIMINNNNIGHSTHTSESANVEAQKSLILKTAVYASSIVRAE
jgi:hypothetical protein